MRFIRGELLVSACVLAACGDDGRESADAGQTDSNVTVTATVPATTTLPTTSVGATQGATDSDAGTASDSQGQTTTTTLPTSTTDTTSPVTATTTEGTTSTTTTVSTSSSTTDVDTDSGDPCSGTGTFEYSYLWVANTTEGSISKIDTKTLTETGRYYADPNQTPGVASTSRTSVNIDGHFVVVSNRGTGTVTKVAANIKDCVDKNANGTIETSQNKDDLLPWGTDECVLWNVTVSPPPDAYTHGPRGTAWAPGDFNPQTCKYDNQAVWVGWMDAPGHGNMASFDGATGQQLDTVSLDNWSPGSNYSPYGAAADGTGHIWFTAVYEELARIDTETLELKRWPGGGIQFYGMTVDGKGNPWFGPYANGNVAYFDAATETFHEIPGTNENHRGVAVDQNGMAWVAANAGGGHGCGLNQIDTNTKSFVQFLTFDQCSTPVGVSIDVDGFVWMVDFGGWAYRIDPNTYQKVQVLIPGDHYTYSDMTGGALIGAVTPG